MYQRQMRYSIGAIRRPLAQEKSSLSNCAARPFHISACRLEDDPKVPVARVISPVLPTTPQRESRTARARTVISKIDNLQSESTPHPSRFSMNRTAPPRSDENRGVPQSLVPRTNTNGTPRPFVQRPGVQRSAPPPGTMARAPTQLRITRTAVGSEGAAASGNAFGGGPKPGGGPNLGRRGGNDNGPRSGNRPGESGPKRRERKKPNDKDGKKGKSKGKTARPGDDLDVSDGLSDGMVQQLLRLQRNEWDKVQYVPKYAEGSEAAKSLVEEGKALFEGSRPEPEVRVWGRLEKTIGIVGMHGA